MMKKRSAVLLAATLGLLCAACSGGPSDTGSGAVGAADKPPVSAYGAALDEAFRAEHAVFEQRPFPKPDPASCRIAVPAEDAWEAVLSAQQENKRKNTVKVTTDNPNIAGRKRRQETESPEEGTKTAEDDRPDEAAVRRMLAEGELVVYDYSPDGKHGIGFLSAGEKTYPVSVSEDSVAVVCPSRTRGAEDQYGLEMRFYLSCWQTKRTGSPFGMGRKGMIWSPGGRYCCGLNREVIRDNMALDRGGMPVIVDTQTGEMFLLDAYPENIMAEDGGILYEGCFTPDEQYFCGMFFGPRYASAYGSGFVLIRYSLADCKAEKMMDLHFILQTCAQLPDGRLLLLSEKNRKQDSGGNIYRKYTEIAFAGDGRYAETLEIPLLDGEGDHELVYSPVSGMGLLLTSTRNADEGTKEMLMMTDDIQSLPQAVGLYGMSLIDPDRSLADSMDTIWMVFGQPDDPRIDGLKTEHFLTLASAREYFIAEGTERPWRIYETELSPDGHYAAVLAVPGTDGAPGGRTEPRVVIVRLSDMKALVADAPEAYAEGSGVDLYKLSVLATRNSLLNWSEAGLIFNAGTPSLWQLKGLE